MAIAIQKTTLINAAGIVAGQVDLAGRGPARLFVKNLGANALGAATVALGSPGIAYLVAIDTTTFATLASGAVKSLVIAAPVGLLVFVADKGGGDTTLLTWVEVDPGA